MQPPGGLPPFVSSALLCQSALCSLCAALHVFGASGCQPGGEQLAGMNGPHGFRGRVLIWLDCVAGVPPFPPPMMGFPPYGQPPVRSTMAHARSSSWRSQSCLFRQFGFVPPPFGFSPPPPPPSAAPPISSQLPPMPQASSIFVGKIPASLPDSLVRKLLEVRLRHSPLMRLLITSLCTAGVRSSSEVEPHGRPGDGRAQKIWFLRVPHTRGARVACVARVRVDLHALLIRVISHGRVRCARCVC